MVNRLQHLIFIIFPELLQVIKNVSSKTGLFDSGDGASQLRQDGSSPSGPSLSSSLPTGGLDLYEISSGRHKGQGRISKRGRKLLYFAAINTVRANGIMHAPYRP